jgi:hypothetical protein
MRKRLAFTAGLLSFVLAVPAGAQRPLTVQGARSMVGGITNQPIQMKMVDTSKALAPMNVAGAFRPVRPPTTFTLSRFFPKITAGPWPPKLPSVMNLFKAAPTPTAVNPNPALRFRPQ